MSYYPSTSVSTGPSIEPILWPPGHYILITFASLVNKCLLSTSEDVYEVERDAERRSGAIYAIHVLDALPTFRFIVTTYRALREARSALKSIKLDAER